MYLCGDFQNPLILKAFYKDFVIFLKRQIKENQGFDFKESNFPKIAWDKQ